MSKITDELSRLSLDTAEAFFALTIHRVNGRPVPTATVFADALAPNQRRRILESIITAATGEMLRMTDESGPPSLTLGQGFKNE